MNGDLIKLVEKTNNDTKEIVLSEAYQLFESQMMDLAEKYKNGEITNEEYQIMLENFLRDLWNKLQSLGGQTEIDPEILARQQEISRRARHATTRSSDKDKIWQQDADDIVRGTQRERGVRPGKVSSDILNPGHTMKKRQIVHTGPGTDPREISAKLGIV